MMILSMNYYLKKWLVGQKLLYQRIFPTFSALAIHSLCVFCQFHKWIDQYNQNLLHHGWKQISTQFLPMTSSLHAAPDALFKVIKWNGWTSICSSKKYGLECLWGTQGTCLHNNWSCRWIQILMTLSLCDK